MPRRLNRKVARLTLILATANDLLWMFKSRVFRWFVDSLSTGRLIQHLFTTQLAELALLPPLLEQQRIVAEVECRLSVVDELEAVIEANLRRGERLRLAILKRAFEGKLAPQGPSDEPASVLLERVRAGRTEGKRGGHGWARAGAVLGCRGALS